MLRDGENVNEVAWFYSTSTAFYSLPLSLALFMTDAYLYAGHVSYLPVFVLLAVAEIVKYTYIRLVYQEHNIYKPKQGFKLGSILFHFMKEMKIMELLRCGVVLAGCTVVVFAMAVLFGAPFLDKHEETLMFSCLVTVFTCLPICLHQGVLGLVQFLNGTQASDPSTQVLLRNVQFTALGAWIGAFVIPLDWARRWQVWPIPCSLGAMFGFTLAQCFSMLELFTKGGKLRKMGHKFR